MLKSVSPGQQFVNVQVSRNGGVAAFGLAHVAIRYGVIASSLNGGA